MSPVRLRSSPGQELCLLYVTGITFLITARAKAWVKMGMHRRTRNSWSFEGAWRRWARNGSLVHEKQDGTRAVSYCSLHPSISTTAYIHGFPALLPRRDALLFWDWQQDFPTALEVLWGQPYQLPEPTQSALLIFLWVRPRGPVCLLSECAHSCSGPLHTLPLSAMPRPPSFLRWELA